MTVAAAAALLITVACSGETDAPAVTPEDVAEQTAEAAVEEEAQEGEGTTVLNLEDTHTYGDGLSVHLSDFERFNSADEGDGDDAEWFSFTVTFTNDSDIPVEIDRIVRNCQVDGQVSDPEAFEHLAHEWPTMIEPGSTGIWQPACEMAPDAEEFQWDMAVFTASDEDEPSYPTVYWTGTVD
jgi:hypothetical protein